MAAKPEAPKWCARLPPLCWGLARLPTESHLDFGLASGPLGTARSSFSAFSAASFCIRSQEVWPEALALAHDRAWCDPDPLPLVLSKPFSSSHLPSVYGPRVLTAQTMSGTAWRSP